MNTETTSTVWSVVTDFCLNHLNESRKNDPLPMIPTDGEPWLSYAAIGTITGKSSDYVSNVVSKHKIRKHPVFSGFTKLSFFESIESGVE